MLYVMYLYSQVGCTGLLETFRICLTRRMSYGECGTWRGEYTEWTFEKQIHHTFTYAYCRLTNNIENPANATGCNFLYRNRSHVVTVRPTPELSMRHGYNRENGR